MKNILNYLKTTLLLIVLNIGMVSCHTDEPTNVCYDLEAIAIISCSPDLLEFVTPTVEIKKDNEETQQFVLSAADFEESDEWGKILINTTPSEDNSISSTTTLNNFAKKSEKLIIKLPFKGSFSVRYKKKSDYVLRKERYIFYNNIGGIFFIDNKKAKEYVELPIASTVESNEVEDYLTNLIMNSFDIEYEIVQENKNNIKNKKIIYNGN